MSKPSFPVTRRVSLWALTLALPLATAVAQTPATPPAPPVAVTLMKVDTIHGDVLVDNYFWLRDRKNPDVVKYLEAENVYTAAMTKHIEPLQEQLYKEMLARIKQTDLDVPAKRDSFYYYTRTEEGKQYSIFARRKGSLEAPEERSERDGTGKRVLPPRRLRRKPGSPHVRDPRRYDWLGALHAHGEEHRPEPNAA